MLNAFRSVDLDLRPFEPDVGPGIDPKQQSGALDWPMLVGDTRGVLGIRPGDRHLRHEVAAHFLQHSRRRQAISFHVEGVVAGGNRDGQALGIAGDLAIPGGVGDRAYSHDFRGGNGVFHRRIGCVEKRREKEQASEERSEFHRMNED